MVEIETTEMGMAELGTYFFYFTSINMCNHMMYHIRIIFSAWLEDDEDQVISIVDKRIEDMTNLNLDSAEQTQVCILTFPSPSLNTVLFYH